MRTVHEITSVARLAYEESKVETISPAAPESYMESVVVTPDLARKWLAEFRFDRQRLLRPERVSFYANEIRAGRWYPSVIDFRYVASTGQQLLVNGYHRLEAVIAADMPVQMFTVHLPVQDQEELAAHYSTFDQHSRRGIRDTIRAYNMTSETGLFSKQIERITATAAHIESGFMVGGLLAKQARSMSQQQKIAYVRRWVDPATMAYATIGEANLWRVRRIYVANVFSVVLVTFRYQPHQAEAFWRKVATQEDLKADSPEHRLGDLLSNYKAAYNSRDNRLPRLVATVWNAFMEGRSLTQIKVYDAQAPIRIAGTPYKGTAQIRPDAMLDKED